MTITRTNHGIRLTCATCQHAQAIPDAINAEDYRAAVSRFVEMHKDCGRKKENEKNS